MQDTYTVGEMAARLHKSRRTLQQWDRDGKLIAFRTPTGRRFYTHSQLLDYFGEKPEEGAKSTVAYCRVSSQAQKPDLANQRKVLEDFCVARGFAGVEFIEEVGGGMNFKRKKFLELIDGIVRGDVNRLIIAHKDRLVRFGFDLIAHLAETYGCKIEVVNQDTLSPQQEMVEDLLAIVHTFSCRLYGMRKYKKETE